jgi:phenylacetate-CoA ligase
MEWERNKFYDWKCKKEIIREYFMDNDEPLELWDEEKQKKYTERAVKETVCHALQNNNYYRQKLQDAQIESEASFSMEKFEQISYLTKQELIQKSDLILSVPREEVAQVFLSTGTTGQDMIYVMHTWEDLFIHDMAAEMPLLFPVKCEDFVAVALPYEMSSAGLSFHRVVQDGMGGAVISLGKGGAYSDPGKAVRVLRELQCPVLVTSPSYAMHLFDQAVKMGISIEKELHIKTIWLTGEGCSHAFRKRIEKLWNCNAYFYYGSLECGPIGIECKEQNGYHITSGHVYVEIVNPKTQEILAPGEIGEIVVTTLLKDGSPFIRYRTQDTGYIEEGICECGIKLKRLFLRGRKSDHMVVDGKEYSPYYVEEHLMRLKEVGNNYRLIVYENCVLIITEANCKVEERSELEEIIASKVEFGCGLPNKVKIVDEIGYTGKKAVRVEKRNGKLEEDLNNDY